MNMNSLLSVALQMTEGEVIPNKRVFILFIRKMQKHNFLITVHNIIHRLTVDHASTFLSMQIQPNHSLILHLNHS
ncbi:hypothetical protein KU39_4p3 (plasmid) [Piscirickettsia salmonis]|uniref:Uncharacterized protein n=1 Tax=Piscirickettsia salmonis TaxID=1238 RepID=A0AAC8VLV4_PISSA|nr:hypothetical protein KU39_4p3 [Piscirickettsia salmonis]